MTLVNALNEVHGQVLVFVIALVAMVLLFVRYKSAPHSGPGSFIDALNGVHVTAWGVLLALVGIAVVLANHETFGDKVFVAGASFIGGMGAAKLMSSNGNGNKPPEVKP